MYINEMILSTFKQICSREVCSPNGPGRSQPPPPT